MSSSLGIALLGCGTVGSGVAKILLGDAGELAARAGRPIDLRHVIVRNPSKRRACEVPPRLISTLDAALGDPDVQAVIEVVGGTDWARRSVLAALAAGKHVVTANKALLSEHGPEILDAADRAGVSVSFEASVAGGVPIIAALTRSFAGNPIASLQGILNGTSNFILTRMSEQNCSYAEALAQAQERGYAEVDPTLDVNGTDSAHKLAILARLAFGISVRGSEIAHRGIADIDPMDLRFARELGYAIKLVAEAWSADGSVALHVSPLLLKRDSPLAQVSDADNAIRVSTRLAGDNFFRGPGAGQMPTASAIIADVIDLAVSHAQPTFQSMRLGSMSSQTGASVPVLRSAAKVRTRFYLRLIAADQPGVLADVAHALAEQGISIASVMQHEAVENGSSTAVPVVIMTHTAATDQFRFALERIDRLPFMASRCVYYPVAE